MDDINIDTDIIKKGLKSKGYSKNQAEGFVDAIETIDFSNMATKSDIDGVKSDINEVKSDIDEVKSDIESLRLSTKSDLKEEIRKVREEMKDHKHSVEQNIEKLGTRVEAIKAEIFKWAIPVVTAQTAVLALILRTFLPHQ